MLQDAVQAGLRRWMLERQDRKVDGWDEPETRPFLKAIYAFGHQFAVMGFQDIRMVKTEAALRPEVNGSDSGAFDVCKTPGLERKLARGSGPHFDGRGGFRRWSSKLQVCMSLLARRGAVRKHPRLDIGSSQRRPRRSGGLRIGPTLAVGRGSTRGRRLPVSI